MDDVLLSQLVEHLLQFWEHFLCSCLVLRVAEVAEVAAHSLCIVAVVESALLVLADALET